MTPLPPGFLGRPFAHRGLHDPRAGRPENSLAAAAAAIGAGYGIECDLQLSRDGVPVVFHDAELDRLTASPGATAARTTAELERLTLLGTCETIPTLDALLALLGGQVPLLVELKDQTGVLGPGDGRLEAATAQALASYAGPVAAMSFNPSMVARMRALAPSLPAGLVTCAFTAEDWPAVPAQRREALARIAAFGEVGASFISHDRRDLAAPAVARLKAAGVPVCCWTVRSPGEEREARAVADQITFEGYLPDKGADAAVARCRGGASPAPDAPGGG